MKSPALHENVTRRGMVGRSLASAAIMTLPAVGALGREPQDLDNAVQLVKARKKLAHQPRPIILDDDGDIVYDDQTLDGREAFLALRMHAARKAKIKSVAWCIMWAIAVKGKNPKRYWQMQLEDTLFQDNLSDPTHAVAEFGRANNMEIFGSLRMNDCHDAFGMPFNKLVYPLKVEHPELLIGTEQQRGVLEDGLGAAMWSGLDYAFEQVREDRLRWIERTVMRYDLDGVDMNFFRMPWVFRQGEEEKNMPLMTQFIRQARCRVDAAARRHGRPILLGARVPGTIETCRRIGFDIETWLKEGLIDRLLTGGGYVCYSTPAEELVALGHRYEVPVYPCINCPANFVLGADSLRGAASNFWWAGADGLYLWNFHYIPGIPQEGRGRPTIDSYVQHLPEIADPQRLKYLDKTFAVNQRVWEQYQRASAMPPLPLNLTTNPGGSTIPLRIGDDVATAHHMGRLRDATLQIQASGSVVNDVLAVAINGLPLQKVVAQPDGWLEMFLKPKAVRQGVNQLKLGIARRGESAVEPIVVEQVRVRVRYRD